MRKRLRNLTLEGCFLYAISSPKDLARRLSIKGKPIEVADLNELAADIGNYRIFKLAGRPIQQPKPGLQAVHLRVHRLLSRVEVPDYLHSAVRGRSYLSNASAHSGTDALLKIDIKKFFASVPESAVLRFLRKSCRCRSDVARLLARILTYNGMIATGSSASPILAYYSFKPMFDEIAELATTLGLKFTCYVDDMTLSGPAATAATMMKVRTIIAKHGLHSHKARKFAPNNERIVTGVCITDEGSRVPNKLLRKIADDFEALSEGENGAQKKKRIGSLLGRLEAAGLIDPSYRARAATLRATPTG
jgi:hypothetical protein